MSQAAPHAPRVLTGLLPNWCAYVVAAVLSSAITVVAVTMTVRHLMVPMSEEYEQLVLTMNELSDSDTLNRIAYLQRENTLINYRQYLALAGFATASMLGLGAGIGKEGGFLRGILGAVLGATLGSVLGWTLAPVVISLVQSFRGLPIDSLLAALVIHIASWSVLMLATALTIGVVRRSWKKGFEAMLFGVVGAAIGVVAAVLGGASIEKFNVVEQLIMDGNYSRLMWASLPPLLTGLILARSELLGTAPADEVEIVI